MVQALNRRDRVRAATTEEIKQTARRILVSDGPDAVSLRAIAREMGMTAPALYRYFGSHEDLVKHVIADIFTELTADLQAAIAAAGAASDGDLTAMVIAAAREFRRWSLTHEREFGLLFGTPLPGVNIEQDEITSECGGKFGNTFFLLILELWRKHPFPVPADDEIDPGPARAARALPRVRSGNDIPGTGDAAGPAADVPALLGAAVRHVSLEVFGHLGSRWTTPTAVRADAHRTGRADRPDYSPSANLVPRPSGWPAGPDGRRLMPVAGPVNGSNAGDQVAVFIDLENLAIGAGEVLPGQADPIPYKALELLCRDYGNTSIRRAYADWSRPEFASTSSTWRRTGSR